MARKAIDVLRRHPEWTDEQLAEALRRFERGGLGAEADGIRGEQNRREQVAAGNLKPSKARSSDRIDGMVSLLMALGRAMLAPVAAEGGFESW